MQQASGTFEVKLTPAAGDDAAGAAGIGRLALDKTFRGDLAGTSVGTMLSVMGHEKGSAGYVAIERVTATLHGRQGTFALQHVGVMNRGAPSLEIRVIPDSGTADLTGLSGALVIRVEDGKHFYDFSYELP
ncbi:MAG: DUF3224 domain-containing protein [Gemmatimonadaceae bacterium]